MNYNSSVDLCLACSSSLPPLRLSSNKVDVFTTQCCNRPICPACISANPRLARYNPCLMCLGGVGIIIARATPKPGAVVLAKDQNLDGGIQDEDVFTLGDDDDDEDDLDPDVFQSGRRAPSTPPPAYTELGEPSSGIPTPQIHEQDTAGAGDNSTDTVNVSAASPAPSEYYIQPKDTLVGIAFRFGVDGRLLCRLNGLPPSTLRTTPHLLHTRTVLKLPSSTRSPVQASAAPRSSADPEREARRARERTEKRFQTVTKETDWRIAKAYVALAEDVEQDSPGKEDVNGKPRLEDTTEARAMDQYLDDEEWEARERREGREVQIPRFPFTSQSSTQKGKDSTSRWRWP